MPLRHKTLWTVLGAVAAVVALSAVGVALWLPSEEQLARRAEAAVEEALGVPVTIGALHWQLLPQPMVEVRDVATRQDSPVRLQRLAGWPQLRPLLHGEIAFDRVLLDGATIPQPSLRAFRGADEAVADGGGTGRWQPAAVPVRRVEFRNVAWVGRRGIPLEFEGQADFEAGWKPRTATLARQGVQPPAQVTLERDGDDDRWRVTTMIAGGSWDGLVALATRSADSAPGASGPAGGVRITGELEPKGVEVRQLTETFKRNAVVAGRASGRTTLSAEGDDAQSLLRSLRTRTTFTVAPATVLRFDLDRAIRSLGKEHAGTTPLDRLTGQLDTRNTEDGLVMRYTQLRATSGVLTATGNATLANRKIDAELAVDLVEGVVGVPLKITGPVTQPDISVPAGAVAGAAVGTAVAPGIGTAIGARIGGLIEKVFGGGDKAPAPPKR